MLVSPLRTLWNSYRPRLAQEIWESRQAAARLDPAAFDGHVAEFHRLMAKFHHEHRIIEGVLMGPGAERRSEDVELEGIG